jgi:hypothetical protein
MVAWCRRWLGADPVEVLFRAGYLSEVTGPRLAAARFPCPRPLAGPAPLGALAATAEELVPGGHLLPPGPDAAGRPRRRPQRPSGPAWLDRVAAGVRDRLAGLRLAPGLAAYEQARGGPRRPAGLRRLRVAGVA